MGRPWDIARRAIQIAKLANPRRSAPLAVIHKLQAGGLRVFFRQPTIVTHDTSLPLPPTRRRMFAVLRTLARVGPWGAGFLVWDAFGPGLS